MEHLEQLLYIHGHPPVNYCHLHNTIVYKKMKTVDEEEIISLNLAGSL